MFIAIIVKHFEKRIKRYNYPVLVHCFSSAQFTHTRRSSHSKIKYILLICKKNVRCSNSENLGYLVGCNPESVQGMHVWTVSSGRQFQTLTVR